MPPEMCQALTAPSQSMGLPRLLIRTANHTVLEAAFRTGRVLASSPSSRAAAAKPVLEPGADGGPFVVQDGEHHGVARVPVAGPGMAAQYAVLLGTEPGDGLP